MYLLHRGPLKKVVKPHIPYRHPAGSTLRNYVHVGRHFVLSQKRKSKLDEIIISVVERQNRQWFGRFGITQIRYSANFEVRSQELKKFFKDLGCRGGQYAFASREIRCRFKIATFPSAFSLRRTRESSPIADAPA